MESRGLEHVSCSSIPWPNLGPISLLDGPHMKQISVGRDGGKGPKFLTSCLYAKSSHKVGPSIDNFFF